MSERKMVVLDGHAANPGDLDWEGLAQLGDLRVYEDTPYQTEDILERIGDSEIVLVNKVPITRQVLMEAPHLKYINVLATGVNNIDLEAAEEKGVLVANVPAYSTEAVAQHTIALLLEIASQVGHYNQAVSQGKWSESKSFTYYDKPLMELSGKTIGIIGFGEIGQAVGRIAKAMGMKVIAYNRTQYKSGLEIADYVSIEEIYRESDIISLHLPLTEDTEKIINKDSLSQMRDGVILLNAARGPLIDEEALVEAYKANKVYAVGMDVAAKEPIPADNPLLDLDRVIITPHVAWAARETRKRLIDIVTDNVSHYLQGRPMNIVSN